jgi:tryptophanyl-tRNA synthetase
MTRDIAIKFNEQYGQTFVIPEPQIRDEVALVPGADGQKMSKSYGNTIEIFGEEKATRKKIMGIVMDSRTLEEPKPDADKNIAIQILNLLNPAKGHDEMIRLSAGMYGYGSVKKQLADAYWDYFAEARKKRDELARNLDYVNSVLTAGATKARTLAQTVLKRARQASGLE